MLSDSKISTLESGFKNFRIWLRIRRMRVDDSRIRKEKVADSKISGYVWTGPECKERSIVCTIALIFVLPTLMPSRNVNEFKTV